MCFSPFETFYPRHVQHPITLAVCEMSIIFYTVGKINTVAPRYNAVVGVHEMEPRCKRGAL